MVCQSTDPRPRGRVCRPALCAVAALLLTPILTVGTALAETDVEFAGRIQRYLQANNLTGEKSTRGTDRSLLSADAVEPNDVRGFSVSPLSPGAAIVPSEPAGTRRALDALDSAINQEIQRERRIP